MSRSRVSFLVLTFIITFFGAFSTSLAYDDTGAVEVTGVVGVTASDMQLNLSSSTGDEVASDAEITYTISYGSNSTSSIPLTLVAQWNQGLIEGGVSPTVELLNYKEGSATTAIGGVTPVIDVLNRKITWTIPTFPAQTTDQTVQFILKTSADYRGSKKVTAQVNAMMTTPSGVPDSSVTTSYRYKESATATPTPSPTATSATSSSTAALVAQPSWDRIELVEIMDTKATFRLSASTDVQVTGLLGTRTINLKEELKTAARARLLPLTFSDLQPDTTYYVQFIAESSNGSTTRSSIYTFKTSSKANPDLIVDRNSIVVSQSWGILFNQSMLQDPSALPHFSVSQDTMLDFLFRIPLSRELKEATLLLRDPYVLGISTDPESEYSSATTRMVEVNPGTFVGKIKTPLISRTYEIAIRTEDIYGNMQEQTVGQTTVVQPFKVTGEKGKPLWGAEVLLWSFQQKTAQYELAPFNALSFQNPISTNKNGTADFSLIPGRYKARVSMKGYQTTEVKFEISSPQVENLPQVTLTPVRFGMIGRFLTGIELAQRNLKLTIGSLPQANPTGSLYDILVPFNIVFLMILLSAIVFKLNVIRFPIRSLFVRFKGKHSQYFQVNVEESETSAPLRHAVVYVVDEKKHCIIGRARTGIDGTAQFPLSQLASQNTFFVKRHGYALASHASYSREEISSQTSIPLTLERQPVTTLHGLFDQELRSMLGEFVGFGSEAFLTFSLLCTLLFTITLSPTRTMAFAGLTMLNLGLWFILARHSYGLKFERS